MRFVSLTASYVCKVLIRTNHYCGIAQAQRRLDKVQTHHCPMASMGCGDVIRAMRAMLWSSAACRRVAGMGSGAVTASAATHGFRHHGSSRSG